MPISILEKTNIRQQFYPITLENYHKLGELGIIPEKTELLEGVVIKKMPKNPIHSGMVSKIFHFLINQLPKQFYIRKEDPLSFATSEPEPDIAIVDNSVDDYMYEHPKTAYLVIEVANTSLEFDREKAHIYALGEIPEYWIINLNNYTLEVYQSPSFGQYAKHFIVTQNETISPLFYKNLQFSVSIFL